MIRTSIICILCLTLSGCASIRPVPFAEIKDLPVKRVGFGVADFATSEPVVAAATAAYGGALPIAAMAAISGYRAWRKKRKPVKEEGTV